jgi:hypothetical protein
MLGRVVVCVMAMIVLFGIRRDGRLAAADARFPVETG